MLNPSVAELMKKVDSRYSLVIAASKRAREIIDGSEKMTTAPSNKPVTIATHEIAEDLIKCISGREQIEK